MEEAEDGPSGIALVSENPPDLLILDLMMPDVDGISLCRALKSNKRTQNMPIIVLTAAIDADTRQAANDAGADRFVNKPWDFTDLNQAVTDLLKKPPQT